MEATATSELELPARLEQGLREDEGIRASRGPWAAALPQTVSDLAARWALQVGSPFQPGGGASWVAPARTSTGEFVVLKVGWLHDEALHEANGLRVWGGNGAVRLFDAIVEGETSALLLETCQPGTPLSDSRPPTAQDLVVADLLRRLWVNPPTGHPFRTLQSMCQQWAAEFDIHYAVIPSSLPPSLRVDPGLARAGIDLFKELPATATANVLLATDLHAGNILAAQREPWLVIDPKPYIGDPTYDVLQHMLNHSDRLGADPHGFADRMAELLDLDRDRLRLWLFARCIQECLNDPDLIPVARSLAP